MIASVKDIIATALVGTGAALAWAHVTDAGWPLTSGTRVVALLVFVAAIASCAVGTPADAAGPHAGKTWFGRVGAGVGMLIGVVALAAIVTGWEAALVAETALTVTLWAFSTVRHLVTRRPAVVAAA